MLFVIELGSVPNVKVRTQTDIGGLVFCCILCTRRNNRMSLARCASLSRVPRSMSREGTFCSARRKTASRTFASSESFPRRPLKSTRTPHHRRYSIHSEVTRPHENLVVKLLVPKLTMYNSPFLVSRSC